MVNRPPDIQTYDPRLGQDCVFFSGPSEKPMFSSLEHGLYVVEAVGEMNWDMHQDLLLECILNTSTEGFFTVDPWGPGASNLKLMLMRQLNDVMEVGHSVLGYFTPSADSLRRLFSVRAECGGGSSGEWCIGGCSTKFSGQDINCTEWNFNRLLHQADKIGCVLSLEEMQQSYFMVKPFDGLSEIIEAIKK